MFDLLSPDIPRSALIVLFVVFLQAGAAAFLFIIITSKQPLKLPASLALVISMVGILSVVKAGVVKDRSEAREILSEVVLTQEEVFQEVGAYLPSELDVTSLNERARELLEGKEADTLTLKSAPVMQKLVVQVRVGAQEVSETLTGDVLSKVSLTHAQLERVSDQLGP